MTMPNPSASVDVPSGERQERTPLQRLLDRRIEEQRHAAKREIARHMRQGGRGPDDDFRLELERRLLGQ